MKLVDIAKLAGVSRTTASYVINGQAEQRRISQATIDKVMAVVQQHQYQIDPQAAALRRGASRLLGLIVPDLENISYARLAKRLEHGARAQGYQLLIVSADDNPDSERALALALRAQRCEVLITASCLAVDDPFYVDLMNEGWPVVGIDRGLAAEVLASVVSDDQVAAEALTESILLGPDAHLRCQHVVWLDALPDVSVTRARKAGYEAALQRVGLTPRCFSAEHYSREAGMRLADQVFQSQHQPIDALVTASFTLMEGVLDWMMQQSYWPNSLQLATFGDHPLLDLIAQPVNTALQDYDRIAQLTLDAVLAATQGHYQPGLQVVPRQIKQRI
ncbi:DNA-binding transcriptional regulator FruR [Terasakiispira papahanaumokuakeensis]|uniref:DNA-binding transcriptional regulator FruR n=1 Tax=Terasakiispira papahanaumokuakeensis TaxID=197479 RepID=A0A1E2VEB1_9GAMM|nr:catabolite repressor/activator [Terasakiispira papahanaumokuakeensis]ODC05202.1 DNA-binding transcriptional regulator FruR [Terasakiispira papahanaumokuakeensis]